MANDRERRLREALAAYQLDLPRLRRFAALGGDVRQASSDPGATASEVAALLDALAALLRPSSARSITW